MDYSCGPLILSSQDKIRMLDFLSDVFEFDVDTESDIVNLGHFGLKLVDSSKNPESTGVTFAFQLREKNQLEEIKSKFDFFIYRKSQDPNSDRFTFVEECHESMLQILDFDGRTWRFELPN